MRSLRAIAIAGLAVSAGLAAQKPDVPQPPQRASDVIRLGVDLVRVDATVTDQHGRHVSDLTQADFELLQDGRRQTISTFDYVRLGALPAAPDAAVRPSGPRPTRAPAPHEIRRTIAFVVDDLGLALGSIARVRTVLQRFLDTQMQPGDLVAILRTGGGMGALQQFSADRGMLQAAVDRVRWNMSGRVSLFQSQSIDQLDAFHNEVLSAGSLGAVAYVARGLSGLPGRKSVILLSDGFGLNERVLAALRTVVEASSRAGVVVYGIDMRGLVATGPTASDQTQSAPAGRQAELRGTQNGMDRLAAETGGLFIKDTNDVSGGLARVLEDQQGYYLLGYVPDGSTFTDTTPRFHTLTVRVKRPGLRVRSRRGFLGVPDDQARARSPQNRLAAAVMSPFAGGEIRLQLSSFFGHDEKLGAFVTSVLHVDARDLTFAEQPDGTRTAAIEVLATTFGENGQVADQVDRRYTFTGTSNAYDRAQSGGLVYRMQVPLKQPGPYQLRIALRDVASDRIGSASRFIDVPDVKNGKLTLSGLVIEGVAQTTAGVGAGADARDPTSTLAVRAFRQGTDASYVCSVYNARRGPDGLPQLDVEARLYREGLEVFRRAVRGPLPVPAGTPPLIGGVLHLEADMPLGDYVLELNVSDRLGKKGTRATQAVDFSVTR